MTWNDLTNEMLKTAEMLRSPLTIGAVDTRDLLSISHASVTMMGASVRRLRLLFLSRTELSESHLTIKTLVLACIEAERQLRKLSALSNARWDLTGLQIGEPGPLSVDENEVDDVVDCD